METYELLIWGLQALTAFAWAIGGFMLKRLFTLLDRMEDRIDQHDRAIAKIQGRMQRDADS